MKLLTAHRPFVSVVRDQERSSVCMSPSWDWPTLLVSTQRTSITLALSGQPDWVLAQRIVKDEFAFVTNNRADFIALFGQTDLHPGLIVLIPNVVPALERALLHAALQYSAGKDLVNTVIEVSFEGNTVRCLEYQLPEA